MRRTITMIISAAITIAACSASDETADTDTDTDVPAATGVPTTAAAPVTVPPGTCQDEPDPAAYVEGLIPPAIRPCEPPTELTVHPIRNGVGREAQDGDILVVDYAGVRAEDGALFDTSYGRDVPLDFPLGRGSVIRGWDQGLRGARAGDLLRLDIPSDLAYGDTPPSGGIIQAGDALTFVIEVRAVIAPVTAADAPLDIEIAPSVGAIEVTTEDLAVGDGATAEPGDTAIVHMLLVRGDNQVVLFNTWERNDPVQVVLDEGGSIAGLVEGIEGARVGTRRIIRMPPESAFGRNGEPSLGLPADVDLIIVADIVGVY